MELKVIFIAIALTGLMDDSNCWWAVGDNDLWESDFALMKFDDGDSSTGPEKLSIDILKVNQKGLEEKENGKEEEEEERTRISMVSEVDEETIRKAEKMAAEDLLNGLNRILKNNETLKDVFKAENVYGIS